eukprot:scaffold248792_cov33-Tisochrysis_lutea.AAC.1
MGQPNSSEACETRNLRTLDTQKARDKDYTQGPKDRPDETIPTAPQGQPRPQARRRYPNKPAPYPHCSELGSR